jgi:hypothetical protein
MRFDPCFPLNIIIAFKAALASELDALADADLDGTDSFPTEQG